ncbi:MAG: hypothetical protein AAGA99_08975 [Actinomycetota bacterium]
MDREPLLTRLVVPVLLWIALRVGVQLNTEDLDQIVDGLFIAGDALVGIVSLLAARRRTRPLDATGAPI